MFQSVRAEEGQLSARVASALGRIARQRPLLAGEAELLASMRTAIGQLQGLLAGASSYGMYRRHRGVEARLLEHCVNWHLLPGTVGALAALDVQLQAAFIAGEWAAASELHALFAAAADRINATFTSAGELVDV